MTYDELKRELEIDPEIEAGRGATSEEIQNPERALSVRFPSTYRRSSRISAGSTATESACSVWVPTSPQSTTKRLELPVIEFAATMTENELARQVAQAFGL